MNFDFSYLDVAFKNGSVVTVNERDEIAQAVGIKGNKIVFVGTNEDIDRLIDSHTRVIDLAGRSLLPGFNDAHFHPILNGMLGPDMECGMIDTTDEKLQISRRDAPDDPGHRQGHPGGEVDLHDGLRAPALPGGTAPHHRGAGRLRPQQPCPLHARRRPHLHV